MKKAYITPILSVQTIELQQLMAGSLTFDDENGTGSGSFEDGNATGPGLSRRGHNIWDDED